MSAADWAGRDLGERTVVYDEKDAILFALAVGAAATDLDLVFEDRLRVLPTFGLTLAQWAPDVLAAAGAFDDRAVHGSQTLEVHRPLPRTGELRLSAGWGDVWDKGLRGDLRRDRGVRRVHGDVVAVRPPASVDSAESGGPRERHPPSGRKAGAPWCRPSRPRRPCTG